MIGSIRMRANQPEFNDWIKEVDGTLRLWPMQGFACGAIAEGVPVLQIDFLYPPGSNVRAGRLQVHMSLQQARQLSTALLSATSMGEKEMR